MAVRPGSSTRCLGLLSALGVGSACHPCEGQGFVAPPEPNPSAGASPEVIAGEWIAPGVLELSFSKPLSSIGDPDPTRFALVGWDALTFDYSARQCYLETLYQELDDGYNYYQAPSITAVWIAPEDPTRLRLRMSSRLLQCQTWWDSLARGILLVYTDADDPVVGTKLLDENGDPVPDLGPAWAIQVLESCFDGAFCERYYGFDWGHLPQLSALARIPCP